MPVPSYDRGDLGRQPAFTEPYLSALDSFHRLGARQMLAQPVP